MPKRYDMRATVATCLIMTGSENVFAISRATQKRKREKRREMARLAEYSYSK